MGQLQVGLDPERVEREPAKGGVGVGDDPDVQEHQFLGGPHGLVGVDGEAEGGQHLKDGVQIGLAFGIGGAADVNVLGQVHDLDASRIRFTSAMKEFMR